MNLSKLKLTAIFIFCTFFGFQGLQASKLVEIKVVDKGYLMLYFMDGAVEFVDDGKGDDAYHGHHSEADNSYVVNYGDALDLTNAAKTNNWIISSNDDSNYGTSGVSPKAVYRKSRVNGMSYTGWDAANNDHGFDYTHEHFIYLELPSAMEQGKSYTIEINENLNSDATSQSITFDIFNSPSEAIHVNLVGYLSSSRIKSADLYHFLGDGGNRDYSGFVGNEVYIYNIDTEESQSVGSVKFWMESKTETNHNLTGSDVWNIDFNGFNQSGTYRIAVEGIGCSEDFEIRDDIYHDPYKLGVLGYFYMRIGEDSAGIRPVPRRPLYIQDQDPSNCKIYITDMDPYHAEWNSFASGDKWDKPSDWVSYKKEGNPTNPNAIGGHSDALDWDRHLGHVLNVYDLCLAYIVSGGVLDDDDLRIAESGNGIPDILDEARNEVDFWLNLRYKKGYSHGLTNPDGNNNLYQADNTPIAAWANALNCAMLAYCFQIAGQDELKSAYQDSAIVAFNYVQSLENPLWDTQLDGIRGTDFYMMTAAYLYNLTGETKYEDIVNTESMVRSSTSDIYQRGSYNQLWGTAAYLLTQRTVNYPGLYENMKSSLIVKAKSKEAGNVNLRPSRRGYSSEQAWWQTSQDMHRTVLAHALTNNPTEQVNFLDALILEADWGLGRNPLNMIQMTTATTELAGKRSVENCYTSGRNDGTPGLHPGHTPYLNIDGWGGNMVGSNPKKVLALFYPDYDKWAHASKYINTRYIWAHSEFTPRQTMRGKALLYAYLYSLSKSGGTILPEIIADAGPDKRIKDEDKDGKETVQLDGSGSYAPENQINSYKWRLADSVVATGIKPSLELDTGSYQIELEVEDTKGNQARDTVKIEIVVQMYDEDADYDFETIAQTDDWYVENWGENGSIPLGSQSDDKARSGSYSYRIEASFASGSEHTLRRDASLTEDVDTIRYHVWVSQELVDSANAVVEKDASQAGGIQNYLMHTDWQWVSEWYGLENLSGNGWNVIDLKIPDDVDPTTIQSFGISFKTNGVDIGESNVYVDDIFFIKGGIQQDTTSTDTTSTDTTTTIRFPDKKKDHPGNGCMLYTNYPNPFRQETKIKYYVPFNDMVEIDIYDLAGRRVKNLVREWKNKGLYEVVCNGNMIAKGTYFYRLKVGEYNEVKKMIFLK